MTVGDPPRRQRPLTPEEVAEQPFTPSRRGYDAEEVRRFLADVADELADRRRLERQLRRQLDSLERRMVELQKAPPPVAPVEGAAPPAAAEPPVLDETLLMEALGAEAATILRSARVAAEDVLAKARQDAARIVERGETERNRIRQDAEAEAARIRGEAEGVLAKREREAQFEGSRIIETAKEEARAAKAVIVAEAAVLAKGNHARASELVEEALATRERVLGDLTRRRRVAQVQIEQLRAGRERLIDAYRIVRRTLDEVTDELQRADAEARAAMEREGNRPRRPSGAPTSSGPSSPSGRRASGSSLFGSSGGSSRSVPASSTGLTSAARLDRDRPRFGPGGGDGAERASSGLSAATDEPEPAAADADPLDQLDADWLGPVELFGSLDVAPPEPPESAPNGASSVVEVDVAGAGAGPAQVETSRPSRPPMPPMRPLFAVAQVPGPAPAVAAVVEPELLEPQLVADPVTPVVVVHEPSITVHVDVTESQVEAETEAPEATVTAEAPAPTVPGEEPDTAGAVAHDADEGEAEHDAARSKPAVDELFARLRASRAENVARAERVLAGDADEEPARPSGAARRGAQRRSGAVGEVPVSDEDEVLLQRRDAKVDAVQAPLTKRLKRALQDEQNDLLDRLRGLRQRPTVTNLLPSLDAQAERYRAAAMPFLGDAALAGAHFLGGTDGFVEVGDLASALAASIVGPLRSRLERALANDHGDDTRSLADDIGGAYREWKSQRIDDVAGDQVIAAFCRGALASVPPGTPLRWVVDDPAGPCPDCDDDALARPVPAGEEFPTGQLHPPAHAGCRCLLAFDGPPA
jgi:DivIVA domain-containing protein